MRKNAADPVVRSASAPAAQGRRAAPQTRAGVWTAHRPKVPNRASPGGWRPAAAGAAPARGARAAVAWQALARTGSASAQRAGRAGGANYDSIIYESAAGACKHACNRQIGARERAAPLFPFTAAMSTTDGSQAAAAAAAPASEAPASPPKSPSTASGPGSKENSPERKRGLVWGLLLFCQARIAGRCPGRQQLQAAHAPAVFAGNGIAMGRGMGPVARRSGIHAARRRLCCPSAKPNPPTPVCPSFHLLRRSPPNHPPPSPSSTTARCTVSCTRATRARTRTRTRTAAACRRLWARVMAAVRRPRRLLPPPPTATAKRLPSASPSSSRCATRPRAHPSSTSPRPQAQSPPRAA